MKYKGPVLLLALCFVFPLSKAQQSSMSASAGLGPGNSFTLFITFQNPMTKVQGIGCAFQLQGNPKPGQEDFVQQLRCSGSPMKDDDTHYRIKVGDLPPDIAAGDYKIAWINVSVDGDVGHQYRDSELPTLAPVTVSNPRHLEFSPIKKLETKQ
jgi:hypothetical protein